MALCGAAAWIPHMSFPLGHRMQCWRCRGEGFLVIPWGMRPVVCDTCGGVGSFPEVDVEPDNPLIDRAEKEK